MRNFEEGLRSFELKIGYTFLQKGLLEQAFTHKSFAFEHLQGQGHNERLEFLGDAVLNLILAQELVMEFGADEEGALSKKRASLVNEDILAEQAKTWNLAEYLRLGKGETATGGLDRPRILASTYEAFLGAYFLECGYEKVRVLIRKHFERRIRDSAVGPHYEKDFKSRLQELSQEHFRETPVYEVIAETGPAHERIFVSKVSLKDPDSSENLEGIKSIRAWTGEGSSKKSSEQAAARMALDFFVKNYEQR